MRQLTVIIMLFSAVTANAQVGIGTTTPHTSAQLEVSSTIKGFLPPRMTKAQRDAIVSPAGGLVIYNTDSNILECYNGTNWYSTLHYIGESYGGGIIFFVYDNGKHGLIAATANQSSGISWANGLTRYTGTTGDGLNAGAMNTLLIIANLLPDRPAGNFAAKVCADYSVTIGENTYNDWYLPSKYELNLLYLQKDIVGGFSNSYPYWSSTEVSEAIAWLQNFEYDGEQAFYGKATGFSVRAIRAF